MEMSGGKGGLNNKGNNSCLNHRSNDGQGAGIVLEVGVRGPGGLRVATS